MRISDSTLTNRKKKKKKTFKTDSYISQIDRVTTGNLYCGKQCYNQCQEIQHHIHMQQSLQNNGCHLFEKWRQL